MLSMMDVKKRLFKFWLVRFIVGGFFLGRGLLRMGRDPYKGVVDLCWVCRVSAVGLLTRIAWSLVKTFIY